MEPFAASHPQSDSTSWSIHGDPALLVGAARKLRQGIETGLVRSHPHGEYAMFGMARLLDAIAFSIYVDGAVHHTVVSGATEIAHHVLTYLLPIVRSDADREQVSGSATPTTWSPARASGASPRG
jgi:hypothetical protein